MAKSKIKLIIWDFDGVIADTEKLWLANRQKLLNEEFHLSWSFDETNKHLGGMSDKTKREILDNLNIKTNQQFWDKALAMDIATMEQGFGLTPHIEDIFNLKQFEQCIATGGIMSKTLKKLQISGAEKYFTKDRVFTVDMVNKGKPAPDLFLLAAEKMGFLPEECLIIEDSLVGLQAGLSAQMTTVAFIGCEMNNNPTYVQAIKNLGIKHIFADMISFRKFLFTLC